MILVQVDTSLGLGPECDALGDRLTAHDGPGLPGRRVVLGDKDAVHLQELPRRPPLCSSAGEPAFPPSSPLGRTCSSSLDPHLLQVPVARPSAYTDLSLRDFWGIFWRKTYLLHKTIFIRWRLILWIWNLEGSVLEKESLEAWTADSPSRLFHAGFSRLFVSVSQCRPSFHGFLFPFLYFAKVFVKIF